MTDHGHHFIQHLESRRDAFIAASFVQMIKC